MLELDHIFIMAQPSAPEANALIDFGLTEGSPNSHPQQGSANRRFFFDNAMLELLYIRDEAEAMSMMGLGLWQRSLYRETGISPFGLCLRATSPDARPRLPFDMFSHQPAYLPAGRTIQIAMELEAIEPMIFYFEGLRRPDEYPADRREPLEHPLGVREISGVRFVVPDAEYFSPAAQLVEKLGVASFVAGVENLVEITFDRRKNSSEHDFRPLLPLKFYW